MNNAISISELIDRVIGKPITLLGIGVMSKNVVEATIELGKELSFPIMFIASRNQVDDDSLGKGYANNWNQARLVKYIRNYKREIGFTGLMYMCRDHGGRWQKDIERKAIFNINKANEKALISFKSDIINGFDLIHIDPILSLNEKTSINIDNLIYSTIEIISQLEKFRKDNNVNAIAYEIGSHSDLGIPTEVKYFQSLLNKFLLALEEKELPKPSFVVGDTGTLLKMKENIGSFDSNIAYSLSEECRKHGIGLKEHNTDYLSINELSMHPKILLTAANVAPEFAITETQALLELSYNINYKSLLDFLRKESFLEIQSGKNGW